MDTASFFTGRHAAKAGVEFNYIDNSLFSLPLHFGGRYIFSALRAESGHRLDGADLRRRGAEARIAGDLHPGLWRFKRAVHLPGSVALRAGRVEDRYRLTLKPGLRYQKQFWQQFQSDVSNVGGTRLSVHAPA